MAARARLSGDGGDLSRARRSHRQSISAGRIGRRDGANSGAEAHRRSRTASHRREPLGRRWQHGQRFRRQGGAGRLHPPVPLAGRLQMCVGLRPVVLPQSGAGKVRALANAGAKRPSALPDVPTVAEQGLSGVDASSWYGLVAPAKTPEPVLARLRDEVAKALEAPDMVARIRELGSEPGTAFGKDFGTFMAAETKKWADVIRTSGAKAD